MKMQALASIGVATLGAAFTLASAPAMAGKPGGGGGGSCSGETAAFVLSKGATNTGKKDFYLANASATCQRYLFSVGNGSYERYNSFRVVTVGGVSEGRVVTTDGISDLLLIRFPVGADMQVDPSSIVIQRIFDPAQSGAIDVASFELAADGHKLVYVTLDEDGGTTFLTRLRFINDVDACVPATEGAPACRYDVGTLLAEHVGNSYAMNRPRWNTDGSWIYLNDPRGRYFNPYISRVSVSPAVAFVPGFQPDIVVIGNQPNLYELRRRPTATGTEELLVYGDSAGTGCRDVRVVLTADCSNGSCTRVNSSTTLVSVSAFWASLQSVDESSITILADGGKEDRKGNCSRTGQIVRAIDSAAGVQTTSLTNGTGPASK